MLAAEHKLAILEFLTDDLKRSSVLLPENIHIKVKALQVLAPVELRAEALVYVADLLKGYVLGRQILLEEIRNYAEEVRTQPDCYKKID